jgi:DNA polymerase IV (DinB-like DNA polymerase)
MDTRQRIILHLDMDSFYASAEMHERPELAGKSVVIGADPKGGKGRGVVSTCSYEARAFGIRSAMPISQAFTLCPHAVFLPPDFPLYSRVSAQVMAILRHTGFRFQQVSIDEAFLDVSQLGNFATAQKFSEQIRAGIREKTGLTCSIGLAPTRLVAKIASDFHKPDGLTVMEPDRVQEFLAPMPVSKIPGIGKKSASELFELDIRTVADLAECDIQVLMGRFGKSAIGLHNVALGLDESEVEERDGIKSVSREITFEQDTNDPELLVSTLNSLAEDVYQNLLEEKLRFRTVTVKIRYQGFVTKTRARSLSHSTDDPGHIASSAQSLFREIFDGRKIRLLGLRLSLLEADDKKQMTLFS